MAKVELKQPVVNEIKELLTDAQSAVLVSYRGITVEQDTAMRKELREADVEYSLTSTLVSGFQRKRKASLSIWNSAPTSATSPPRKPTRTSITF